MARRKPYRQGHLDGLCGLYSVVNAFDLVHPLDGAVAQDMMCRLIEEIDRKGQLGGVVAGGTDAAMLWRLTKAAADFIWKAEGIRLTICRPFRGRRMRSTEAFLEELAQLLAGGGAAIISISGGSDFSHFTVALRVTRHTVQLHDSAGIKFLRRSSLRLKTRSPSGATEISTTATVLVRP